MTIETMEYAVKTFYPYFWQKFKFPVKNEAEFECDDFFKNLRKAVWVHRIVSFRHWHLFVEMNLIQMASSPEMYVSCIFFMISTTIKSIHNRYEPFMTTCSLVTAVAAYVYDKGYHEFLDYSTAILMVFFEEFHEDVFRKFHIWDHLQEYLITNNYSEAYNIVEERTRGNPFSDIVFQLDFVREISVKINSKISVSEHAAVYHQTQKVLQRFEIQGMDGTDMRTPSLGVQQNLNKFVRKPPADCAKDSTKSRSNQIITKQEATCSELYSLSDLKQMVESIDLLMKHRISEVENADLNVSAPKSKELKDIVNPITRKWDKNAKMTEKDNGAVFKTGRLESDSHCDKFEITDMKHILKNQSLKHLLQDDNTSWSVENLKQLIENLKLKTDLGRENRSRGEVDDLQVFSPKSNEFQTGRKQIMKKKDNIVSVKNEDDVVSGIKQSLLSVSTELFHKDEKVSETAGKESTSDDKYIEAADLKRGKQLLPSQIATLSDLKQSLESVKLQILMREAENISAANMLGNYLKVPPLKSEERQDYSEQLITRGKDETAIKENEDTKITATKRCLSYISPKSLQKEAKKTRADGDEIKSIDLIPASPCKSEKRLFQVDIDTLEIKQEKSVAMKETEEISLKLDTMHQTDEQLPQDYKEVLKIDRKESGSEMEKAEDIDIIRDSKKQWEKLILQVDMDVSKMEDSIESGGSAMKEAEKVDFNVDLMNKSKTLFKVETDAVRLKDTDGGSLTEETSEIDLQLTSQDQSKQFPQTYVDLLKIEEKEQSSSAMEEAEEIEEIDLQSAILYSLKDQSLLAETDTVTKDEQSATAIQENLKHASADQSKEQFSRIYEEMVSAIEEIETKQDLTDQFKEKLVQAYTDILRVKEGEISAISVEETEEIKSSTDELKELSLTGDVLKIKDTEEMVSTGVETEGDLKSSLTEQSEEQLVQADMDMSKMQDSEETASEIEESEETELKKSQADQPREQFLLDDSDKPKIEDADHSTPVESNVSDVPSDDDYQLEDENLIEEVCSEAAERETKGTSEITTTPKKSKKKKRRSKTKQQKMAVSESDSQVPSTEDAIKALVSLFQKSTTSLAETYDVLEIPRDDQN